MKVKDCGTFKGLSAFSSSSSSSSRSTPPARRLGFRSLYAFLSVATLGMRLCQLRTLDHPLLGWKTYHILMCWKEFSCLPRHSVNHLTAELHIVLRKDWGDSFLQDPAIGNDNDLFSEIVVCKLLCPDHITRSLDVALCSECARHQCHCPICKIVVEITVGTINEKETTEEFQIFQMICSPRNLRPHGCVPPSNDGGTHN